MAKPSAMVLCVVCAVLAFGLIGFMLPLLLDEGTADSDTGFRISNLISYARRRMSMLQKPSRLPADDAAATLIFRASLASSTSLVGDDLSDVLLAALLSDARSSAAADAVHGCRSHVTSFVETTGMRLQHEIPALFVAAGCHFWNTFSPQQQQRMRTSMLSAANYLSNNATAGGLYDIRLPSDDGRDGAGPDRLAVSTLRQAQASAALRCAGSLFGMDAHLGAGERLRRGLHALYQPSGESGDGNGPFDLGLVAAQSSSSSTGASSTRDDTLVMANLKRVRGLTSDLPQLLFWLEHRDLPAIVIKEIAEASYGLACPVGLKSGRDLGGAAGNRGGAVGAAGVGAVYSEGAPWRVTPIEQAISLVGVLKHMLPLQSREAGPGDFEASDALAALVDVLLRTAPALMQLEGEAASRTGEEVRSRVARLQSQYENAVKKEAAQKKKDLQGAAAGDGGAARSVAKRAAEQPPGGGAPSALPSQAQSLASMANATSPLSVLSSSAFSLTYPEHLIPLPPSEQPMDVHASSRVEGGVEASLALMMPEAGQAGTVFRMRLMQKLAAASDDPSSASVRSAITALASGKGAHSDRDTLARWMIRIARYPDPGLAVVRAGGEQDTVEHVVMEVSRHEHKAVDPKLPEDMELSSFDGISATMLIRGDGHPLAVTTAVAARFYRRLYEDAWAWHANRQRAATEAVWNSEARSNSNKISRWVSRWFWAPGNWLFGTSDRQRSLPNPFGAAPGSNHALVRSVTSSDMLLYLTSQAADVTLLVRQYAWQGEPLLSRWRQMRPAVGGTGGATAVKRSTSAAPADVDRALRGDSTPAKAGATAAVASNAVPDAAPATAVDAASARVVNLDRLCSGPRLPTSEVAHQCCRGDAAAATFTCKGAGGNVLTLPCTYALDDFCDCLGDGSDEPGGSACAGIVPSHDFWCETGIKRVVDGYLTAGQAGHIDAAKVKDGFEDCVDGADERDR